MGKKGFRHDEATRKRISETMKRKIRSGELNNPNRFSEGESPWNKGRSWTEVERLNISVATKQGMASESVKQKLITANLGKTQSTTTRKKRSVKIAQWFQRNRGKAVMNQRNRRISEAVKESFVKNPDLKEHCRIRLKARAKNPEFRRKAILANRINTKPNKPEARVLSVIQKLRLPFAFTGNGKFWVSENGRNFNPDFVDIENQRIIEVFGIYWHKKIYAYNKKENLDAARLEAYRNRGFRVLVIWDTDCSEEQRIEKILRGFTQC